MAAGCRGCRARGIHGTNLFILLLIHASAFLCLRGTLIQNSPNHNRRMIIVIFYHFLNTSLTLRFKIRILHIFQHKASGMIFLPHQNTSFITQIQEAFIIGIMTGSHCICSHFLHQINILHHEL